LFNGSDWAGVAGSERAAEAHIDGTAALETGLVTFAFGILGDLENLGFWDSTVGLGSHLVQGLEHVSITVSTLLLHGLH